MLDTIRTKIRLRRLIRSWVGYRDAVHAAFAAEEPSPSEESSFLLLKANIASQLHFLAVTVPVTAAGDPRHVIEEMTSMLQRHRQLKVMEPKGRLTRDAFDALWHQHYIFLNRLKGMSLKMQRPVRRKHHGVPTGLRRQYSLPRFPVVRLFRFIAHVAAFALAVWIVASALGVTKSADGSLGVALPTTVSGALENILHGLQSLWTMVSTASMPVLITYGPAAVVVVGALLLGSLGYRAFARA